MRSHHRGFSLIELLIIVAILVALTAMIIALFDPFKKKGEAYDADRTVISRQITKAINDYLWERNYPPATFPAVNEKKWICVNGLVGTACTDPPVSGADLSFLVMPPSGLPFMETVPQDPVYANAKKTGLQLTKSGDYYQVLTPYSGVYYPLPDPIARWKLDETAIGTAVEDIAGLNGTHTNMAAGSPSTDVPRVNIENAAALEFDGGNDYIQVTHNDLLTLDTYTISVWVNPEYGDAGTQNVILAKGASNYRLFFNNSNTNTPRIENTGLSPVGLNATAAIPQNAWSHVAVSYDGMTRNLFINGTLSSSDTPTGNPTTNGGNLEIGNTFAGILDDIRLYDAVLTAKQIQWLAEGLF